MDRFPRVVVTLALVVGLLAVPTAGLVADAPGTAGDYPEATPASAGGDPSPGASETPTADRPTTAGDGPGTTVADARIPASVGVASTVANRTPNRLSVGGGRLVESTGTPEPDLGAAVSAGDGEFKGGYVAYLAIERLAAAESDEERQAVIRDVIDLTEDRVEALRTREAVAVRSFHNGTIDRRELLARLASIDAEAGALRQSLADLQDRNRDVITPLSFRFTTLDLDLQSLEGPVRDRVGRAIRGESPPVRVRVRATAEGLSLEWVNEGLYTREAVRPDNYEPADPPEFTLPETTDRLQTLYPHSFGSAALTPMGDRLFQVRWPHLAETGTTVLYFDRSTGEVYREIQRLRLSQIPNSSVAASTGGDFRLAVNRTDDIDGVYRVSVYNATSGAGRDVQVSVAGETVGNTGGDGVLWTLRPPGSFNVSTTVEGNRLNVTVPG